MYKLSDTLYLVTIVFWVGSLWTIGFVVAPALFRYIPAHSLAGMLAGRLFALEAWISMGCAAFALLYILRQHSWRCIRSGIFWVVILMLSLALVNHFGIAPLLAKLKAQALPREVMLSAFKSRFATWHGISSVTYLVESALGLLLVTWTLNAKA